ncbi:PREDICTED: meteorin isoform X2 [Crocodylus porosus]|uniref:meteorin isoform X2 n=1 Tax=Crocodylus porosus TaxID=8502 RepID=UPI00093C64E3|nr:PREDICTED: meteorin isoform X2 [Crocodylus porosus]
MPLVLWALCLGVLDTVLCSYSEDQCSWRGSGLSQESGSVEQISLHCAEGSLEWLYPTGALRLSLSPRLPTGTAGKGKSPRQVTTCIKPSSTFRGAQIYLERDGILELLLSEADASLRPRVRCFNWLPKEKVALFLQSTLHQDISRRIAAFRYELRGDWNSRLSLPSSNLSMEGVCRPCNDTEILMAICTSDFAQVHCHPAWTQEGRVLPAGIPAAQPSGTPTAGQYSSVVHAHPQGKTSNQARN